MRLNPLPAYAHQTETTSFILNHARCLITSDPGTGKTRSVLDAHNRREAITLVIAPLSILEAAWADDIKKFQPTINYGVAYAKNRAEVFADTNVSGTPYSPIDLSYEIGPSSSLIPHFSTIFLAIILALSISLLAPVLIPDLP